MTTSLAPVRSRAALSLVALTLLALGCASGAGGSGTAPAASLYAAPEAARLESDVAWLADDAREGRRAASQGERASAEYIAERFQQLGLQPAGEGGFFQRFEVALPSRDAGGSRIAFRSPISEEWSEWREGVAAVFCSSGEEVVARDLYFAGYGIQDEERGWLDYGEVAEGERPLEGAAVLIVRGAPQTDPPRLPEDATGWGQGTGIFHKVMTAKRLGASAVILAQHPRAAGEALLAFDPSQGARSGLAVVTVGATLAEQLLPGYVSSVLAIDRDTSVEERAQHPLTSSGPRASGELRVLGDVVREKGLATNVLARVSGRGGPLVVVGAHYDHLGRGGPGSLDPTGAGQIHNGADDNASGTAVVLELARVLAAGPPPRGDVVFALWSGEEMGLLGSAHWCDAPTVPLAEVSANLNLDMVGKAGNGRCEVLGAGTSPAFASWMAEVGAASGLELQVSLSGQGLGGSDHQSFLNHEVPALHLFTGLHADYHKPTDDLEGFEAEGAARVTRLALELVERMQAEAELAYVAPKVDENAAPDRNRGGMRVRFGSIPVYSYDGEGMLISGTSPNSPAERAGLLAGDVILRIGDIEVDSVRAFAYALKVYKPGDVVKTIYVREGVEESVLVTLESREAQ